MPVANFKAEAEARVRKTHTSLINIVKYCLVEPIHSTGRLHTCTLYNLDRVKK